MSLNRVMLIGHVGKDPQIKYTDTQNAVCQFTLATSERAYTLPNGHQVPEQTDWHDIVCWGALAEFIFKYVKKGDKLYVEGRLKKRSYTDREGKLRTVAEVWGEKVELCTAPGSRAAE